MSVVTKKIGPEEARKLLETMGPPSYPVDPARVSLMARMMKSGAWTLEGSHLVETEEGKLVQGRRRMHAVVEAGVDVEFLVILMEDDPG